jgi:polysaccharide pyruvyl transferase WcaK-like protein
VPSVRDDMRVVATAKVESSYGRRELGRKQIVIVGEAVQRIRRALLRLLVRVPGRLRR